MKHLLLVAALVSFAACSRRQNTPPTSEDHNTTSTGANGNPSASTAPVQCGPTTCAAGQVCCNASCGVCTPPGGMCTQQFCEASADAAAPAPTAGATCATDADCRTFSDYCTGCDCRALARSAPDPTCSGPGVRCLADPCMRRTAACDPATHACVLR